MHEDPQIDLHDDEFFRRGDEGDYAEAESLPSAGITLAGDPSEGENEPTDPAVLKQRVERRARFTRWVKTGMSALALATVAALGVRALSRSPSEPELAKRTDGSAREAHVQRVRAVQAPAQKIESARPAPEPREAESATPPPADAQRSTRSPAEEQSTTRAQASRSQLIAARASFEPQVATGKVAAARDPRTPRQRVAVAAPVARSAGNSALPAVTITKAQSESTPTRPPTARFAD